MSIIISNISDTYSREGIQKYQVKLNRILLCEFEHLSEDGMAVCLQKAAEALDNVDIDARIKEQRQEEIAFLLKHSTCIYTGEKIDDHK